MNKEFQEAAKPLVEYLAKFGLKHEVHKTVVADLYDMVNDLRDERIEQAEHLIDAMVGNYEYQSDRQLQAYVIRLQSMILDHGGA